MHRLNEHLDKWLIRLVVFFLITAGTATIIYFTLGKSYESTVANGEYSIDMVSYIDINTLTLDVDIKTYDGDKIKLIYTNDTPLSIKEGDNRLSIKQNEDFVISFFAFKQFSYSLTLLIPDDIYRDIYITTTSGSITTDSLNCNFLEASTKTGKINLKNVKSQLKATTIESDISCSYYALIQDGDFSSKNGNVSVELPKDTRFSLFFKTETGSVSSKLFFGGEPVRESFRYTKGSDSTRIIITTNGQALIDESAKD